VLFALLAPTALHVPIQMLNPASAIQSNARFFRLLRLSAVLSLMRQRHLFKRGGRSNV